MPDVTFTVDGKKLTAPAGTLLIDACRKAGIEIPAFCYYPGLSLQAACRMCVVRQEKVPKLQTACTTTVAEGQVFVTESPEIAQARKATIELLLGNHPLDCPVCDAGGECELQDMNFKYGAGESLYAEAKHHRDEQQWSPAVFYDRPRCILCYRCTRMCGEGMDVWALGVNNRGADSVIVPNDGQQLDCEQCGMCIDVCPVGALTSGSYRYKTRPWEMNHVSTVCTHCADGCKVTLGVRSTTDGAEIIRADNRDKSGINGDFLCAKGRFGFDFVESADRLTKPLVRNSAGKLEPATWEHALSVAAKKLKEIRDSRGGAAIGVIGSNRTTNEENYLLQKFSRTVLATNNIDHERTTDYASFARALAGHPGKTASLRDIASACAILLVGTNPTDEHPLLAWLLRTDVRLNRARLYIANHAPIKLERQARAMQGLPPNGYKDLTTILDRGETDLAKAVKAEESLIVIFGSEIRGTAIHNLVTWGLNRGPNPDSVRFACLGDHSNSRGAADMGLFPDLLPGYVPITEPGAFVEYADLPPAAGKTLSQMLDVATAGELGALLVVGANPVSRAPLNPAALKNTFLIVQDLFLTETATLAEVVLPAASLYEKSGTVTNTFGDVQIVRKAADRAGVKPDFEILVRLAEAMGGPIKGLVPFGRAGTTADLGQSRGAQSGEADRHAVWLEANGLEPRLSPFDPFALFDEIERLVPGYAIDRINLIAGNDVHSEPASPGLVPVTALAGEDFIVPAHDTLFTSGTLGRYSAALKQLEEHQAKELAKSAAD
ncbi:NADH:ubiquinone oxidoreductase, subunit G, iron-sulfur binding protein [Candidatus Sulfotelmatomonas gaucii]|uniref:NADH-quinone oxidoreductase n=1 Tax=Candidatus Sulfuritelmatomonas gaucii TaxID=2043161 RepID=A0A2N9LT48_9BACT|nr:NADH:ubiquinone oxidoreductase, subunit G, iron-sulfur binding protein [Candidatus Sulfotelmatomonas gaucii]